MQTYGLHEYIASQC